jgi:hypothetical protein
MLWHVLVEATTADLSIDLYETIVLAHTERSAKVSAARAINRAGYEDAHSVEASVLSIRETGLVFAFRRGAYEPVIVRKEATVGQW